MCDADQVFWKNIALRKRSGSGAVGWKALLGLPPILRGRAVEYVQWKTDLQLGINHTTVIWNGAFNGRFLNVLRRKGHVGREGFGLLLATGEREQGLR